MKKLVMVLCCLLLVFIPMTVNAEKKDKIKVYVFYGDGCPHCHKAFEFLDSIEEEYGKYYQLVKFETWYSSSNAKMMKQVAEKLGTDTGKDFGVPYIIIGDKTFVGYAEVYNDDIKKAIKEAYESDSYEDKVKPIVDERNKQNKETIYMACGSITALAILVIINSMSRKAFA